MLYYPHTQRVLAQGRPRPETSTTPLVAQGAEETAMDQNNVVIGRGLSDRGAYHRALDVAGQAAGRWGGESTIVEDQDYEIITARRAA